jgi:uncharacterized protein (TIGR00255 family)
MTGYGRGAAAAGGIRVEVELNAVNRKQFDVRLNLPRELLVLESRLQEQIQTVISRGQVSGSVAVAVSGEARQRGIRVDETLAGAYLRVLRQAGRRLKLQDDLSASLLLTLPDVLHRSYATEEAERVWPVASRALRLALRQLVAMRTREGRALAVDLRRRLGLLTRGLAAIRKRAPQVKDRYRAALVARLQAAGFDAGASDPQVLKELAFFAERSDIAEETTRLASHIQQAYTLLASAEPTGRTLDFLAQEMLREINTIGSKANDVAITKQVIDFKTELERIREQVQNVE